MNRGIHGHDANAKRPMPIIYICQFLTSMPLEGLTMVWSILRELLWTSCV